MEAFTPESISHWHWLAFGVLIMALEIVAPGAIFLWLGIAGLGTGLALAALPDLGWEVELILFAVLSVAAILVGRRFVGSRQRPTDHPTLNRRGHGMVGVRSTLKDATVDGRGRMRVGDTMWAIRTEDEGSDLPEGAEVSVVGVDGPTLIVRKIC